MRARVMRKEYTGATAPTLLLVLLLVSVAPVATQAFVGLPSGKSHSTAVRPSTWSPPSSSYSPSLENGINGTTSTIPNNDGSALVKVDTPALVGETQTQQARRIARVLRSYRILIVGGLLWVLSAFLSRMSFLSPFISPRLRHNVLAGSLIFAVGDAGAQALTYWRQRKVSSPALSFTNNDSTPHAPPPLLDQRRWATALALGAVWAGVCNPAVYDAVERYGPPNVVVKMLLSCSVLSTAGNYVTMLARRWAAAVWTGEKRTRKRRTILADCVRACNADFEEVFWDDLKVWPLYDLVCYSVIPVAIRPVTTALMASAWSMYMSLASAKGETAES